MLCYNSVRERFETGGIMKLKTRLIIAFFIITLAPVVLVSISITALGNFQLKSIQKSYGVNVGMDFFSGNSIQMFDKLTQNVQQDILYVLEEDPAKIEDLAFVEQLNRELSYKYSGLVIRKEEELVYSGLILEDEDAVIDLGVFPEYGSSNEGIEGGIYLGGESPVLIKQMDFIYPDGGRGTVFIVTAVSQLIPEMKSMLSSILLSVVFILLFIGSALTMWIYRAILKPLETLRIAAQNIRDGNLDFAIDVTNTDEIGQLCQDFEEMRQRLKESAEEKIQYDIENKELISNISHDLKTPLTAIKGYVEGIQDGVASSPEKLDKYIRTIYNKANDMDRLIDELTFYSKIDTNKIPYVFAKINVNSYFKDCVEELGLEMESKGIELGYFNYVNEDAIIIADAEQLKRVINNIVSNSVKYLDKKRGIILIRIKDAGDFIQVEIEDNGKGIAQKDLPFIFDRFYRTDSSRNSAQGGSGIGLSIVRKIIEDHGGRIWATSKEVTGTEMHFVLRKYQEVIQDE